MKCKYCEAELAGWGGFCPVCGKNNAAEEQEEATLEAVVLEQEEIVLDAVAPVAEIETEEVSDQPSNDLKKARRIAAMSGCIALLAVLATVLFFGIRGGWDAASMFSWLQPKEEPKAPVNQLQGNASYTGTDAHALIMKDVTVATLEDMELNNAQLQIYYWSDVYNFLDENYYYLSYIGFDYTKPLDEQACYFDKTITWQQYFLKGAVETWYSNAALAKLAQEKAFVMPEEYRTDLDSLEADLTKKATEGGYASLDAMVQESFGAGVTFADYKAYLEVYYLGYTYFETLYNSIKPTDAEIEAYFAANEEALTSQGIKKDGTYTIDVRHILVMMDNIVAEMEKEQGPTNAEDKGEDGYTAVQWEACLAAAQKIYDEWLAGDQTEAHFGELANKYSDDNKGEVTNGGIFTFVSKGDMVEDFNSWCFEEGRKPGDTDIVKTKFGYHVMYFVGSEEVWFTQTRSVYIAEKSNEIVDQALSKYTMTVDYSKIVLAYVEL